MGDFDGRATSPDYRGQRYGDWREREKRDWEIACAHTTPLYDDELMMKAFHAV